MQNKLGIYFGIKGIEVVWARGRKIITSFSIPQEKYTSIELDEKVPPEIKIIALIKDGLRKQRIESNEVRISVSGRDLIIRSFELPIHLPSEEIASAVSFEAKKYLPFKLEEIIFDFNIKKDYKEKKILVIFFGMKREIFNFYLSLIKELGFKLINLEYAAFSLLRFNRILNLGKKGTFAFVNMDIKDEVSFIVMEDNFPLFSRDFYLEADTETDLLVARLKSELQLSLDYYYHRKFPSKHIEKIFIFGTAESKDACARLTQEIELALEFIDLPEYITTPDRYSLTSLKALGVSLSQTLKVPFTFDLLGVWEKETKKKIEKKELEKITLKDFRPSPVVITLCIFMLLFAFGWQFYQRIPIKKEIRNILIERTKIHPVLGTRSEEELKSKKSDYSNKLYNMEKVFNQYIYLTPQLDLLPQIIPEGVWLRELSFLQDVSKRELLLKGRAYLKDYNKEMEAINKFFSILKNNP
ncbi:MAG: pilus assembly protein PilM, partial [Candidatus Omnitrophica bacterium]|nr:pilus assembly protein PilM [Candidatus Omnitrophota bacterium]